MYPIRFISRIFQLFNPKNEIVSRDQRRQFLGILTQTSPGSFDTHSALYNMISNWNSTEHSVPYFLLFRSCQKDFSLDNLDKRHNIYWPLPRTQLVRAIIFYPIYSTLFLSACCHSRDRNTVVFPLRRSPGKPITFITTPFSALLKI